MRRTALLLAAVMAATIMASGAAMTQPSEERVALNRYVVVLENDVRYPGRVASEIDRLSNVQVGFVYRNAIKGFSATMTTSRAEALRSDSRVAYVERDKRVRASAQTIPYGIDRVDADVSSTQAGNGSGAVSNVNAYIIDTGTDRAHADLNVVRHVDFTGVAGGGNDDCNGHGTHVGGTVAAEDNTSDVVGVAPGAPITGVKVLDCLGSGFTSGVIAGVDWVTANAQKPAIANMSLGGGASQSLDTAVKNSANSGVFYAVAAGNDGEDACNASPARAGTHNGVMTTAATDEQNSEASFSNFGSCVDVWAPGVRVLSTRDGGGTTTLSGTSMASPHVGGVGALYLSRNTAASAAATESALKSSSRATGTNSKDGRAIRLVYAGGY